MLGKAALLEPNITGFSRDFKRARYQKLAFVEIYIWVLASTRALLTRKKAKRRSLPRQKILLLARVIAVLRSRVSPVTSCQPLYMRA